MINIVIEPYSFEPIFSFNTNPSKKTFTYIVNNCIKPDEIVMKNDYKIYIGTLTNDSAISNIFYA